MCGLSKAVRAGGWAIAQAVESPARGIHHHAKGSIADERVRARAPCWRSTHNVPLDNAFVPSGHFHLAHTDYHIKRGDTLLSLAVEAIGPWAVVAGAGRTGQRPRAHSQGFSATLASRRTGHAWCGGRRRAPPTTACKRTSNCKNETNPQTDRCARS